MKQHSTKQKTFSIGHQNTYLKTMCSQLKIGLKFPITCVSNGGTLQLTGWNCNQLAKFTLCSTSLKNTGKTSKENRKKPQGDENDSVSRCRRRTAENESAVVDSYSKRVGSTSNRRQLPISKTTTRPNLWAKMGVIGTQHSKMEGQALSRRTNSAPHGGYA